jgi:phosphoglycerol transferase MdoB-like AlkP superfamily enzyme
MSIFEKKLNLVLKHKQILQDFTALILFNSLLQVLLRLIEVFLIVINYEKQDSFWTSEIIGTVFDLLFTNAILGLLFPFFFILYKLSSRLANWLFFDFILVAVICHTIIIRYFLYQLDLLDTFIYRYSLREMLFTITTANVSIVKVLLFMLLIAAIIFFAWKWFMKRKYTSFIVNAALIFSFAAIPIVIFIQVLNIDQNKFSKNKSLYFYRQSVCYLLKGEDVSGQYSEKDAKEFQKFDRCKTFTNSEYPLLHKYRINNVLKPYFEKFDVAPTLVFLIVEGLNDDFIHPYKGGIELMPFLSSLTSKSLYWDRCFTLGERSFGVVPSSLGSLPYGNKGFTLMDNLPRHISLVSLLHANSYYVSFFYGQGSWFHKKDRFFQFNNADLIFDNNKYSNRYQKIIVGDDKFFWGYNDKDLFSQAFEVIDTLPQKPRFDIFFTGTSHSPFAITDQDKYDQWFTQTVSNVDDKSDKNFLNHNKKYIQSLKFADDALSELLACYSKRPEYKNTIFIITGDHPMTELPRENSLKRYHVPLIIYSPGLKHSALFHAPVSHLDIYETILALLSDYGIKVPPLSSALGSALRVKEESDTFRIAFMNDNREIVDYLSGNYYLSNGKLFAVGERLSLEKSNDRKMLKKLEHELTVFKRTNSYVCNENKIIPGEVYCNSLKYSMVEAQSMTELKKFNDEYHSLTAPISVKNKPVYIDISFNYKYEGRDELSMVYQLSTTHDSLLSWNCCNISNNLNDFQAHLLIPENNISDSIISLKLYFWNKSKVGFSYSNLNMLVYE